MKTWIQLAQQQSKTFELATPLVIGQTYTISMNSNEPFMIYVGDFFVGETVDGSLEFIAKNSGDVMIASYSDISMEFEVKLEKGNVATDWTPAPEDVQNEITDMNKEFRTSISSITLDINGITDKVTTVESNLKTNYSTIEYSNELTRNAIDGLTNTYSRLGGANLVMNSALYHGLEDDYDHWRGNLVRLISDTTKSRTAIGLKSGTVYQDIANVQTGRISLRFYVGIQAGLDDGRVQFKINETLYDVVPNNFVEMSFEHTQSDIRLSFITNMSDKYYISDLMMNYGKDMFLDYQQAQNELHTSSVQISERIRVESNVVNTITYLGANGLEGYNKSTGDLVFKQTDTGLEAVSIKSGDAEIAGIAITLVGNQTWFTGL